MASLRVSGYDDVYHHPWQVMVPFATGKAEATLSEEAASTHSGAVVASTSPMAGTSSDQHVTVV